MRNSAIILIVIFSLMIGLVMGKGCGNMSWTGVWWAVNAAVLNKTPEGNKAESIRKTNENLQAAEVNRKLLEYEETQKSRALTSEEMKKVNQLEMEAERIRGAQEKWASVAKTVEPVKEVVKDVFKSHPKDLKNIKPNGWHQTPVSVQAGDEVEIVFAPGFMWTYWPGNAFGTTGPEGNCNDISYKTGGFCAGQALIRFGNGQIQGWTSGKIVANSSGPVFIGIADSGLSDNRGHLELSDIVVNGQSVFSQTAQK